MLTLHLMTTPDSAALWHGSVLFAPTFVHLAHSADTIGAKIIYSGSDETIRGVLANNLVDSAAETFDLSEAVFFTPETLKETLESGTLSPNAVPMTDCERLSAVEETFRAEIVTKHLRNGVRIVGASTVFIAPMAEIEPGVTILPGTIISGRTVIHSGATLGPNSLLDNAEIGCGTTVNSSQIVDSSVGENTTVGPFAYLRAGTTVGSHCRVGDFVEMKNSHIADGTKASHLTYVGDSDVGSNVNFGCGTVTGNYDGINKHRTTIHDNAFIGCNTNLVAPVTVGEWGYTAAGSTITEDVPPYTLAIARARTVHKEGWSHKIKLLKEQKNKK